MKESELSKISFLIDRMRSFADDTAIICGGTEVKYSALLEEYKKAASLLKRHEVVRGSVVALKGEFSPQTIGMILAVIEENCIFVPISTATKESEKYLGIAQVQFLFDFEDEGEGEPRAVRITDTLPSHKILRTLLDAGSPGLVLFSSGSTGEPKAAVHDLCPMLEKYKAGGKKLRSVAFLLFDHIGGFNTVMYSLANGGTLATVKERSPEEVARLVEQYRLEVLPTSPSFLNMMLFSKIYERFNLSSLKLITYGTEPMPESTLHELHRVLPSAKLKQTYGLSEVGIMRTKSEADDSLWLKLGGDDTHQVKVVDGILFIKSKMSMLGYLNAPSPFDEAGWLNTGDRVEQKGEYIRILGRESELINVGGQKVFPPMWKVSFWKCAA